MAKRQIFENQLVNQNNMKKFHTITIKRIDKTVEPDNKGIYPRSRFRIRVPMDIIPTHRLMWEDCSR